MQQEKTIQPDGSDTAPTQKFLISGLIQWEQEADRVLLQRGMSILAVDGSTVGALAAVVLNCRCQEITHILLGQVPPTAVYRLIPLPLIARIDGEAVWLQAVSTDIDKLPIHQPDG